MFGWMKFDIDRWPEVLDKYERPVPAWVAEHDLRWLDNEVRMGRLVRLPGRHLLMKRWGCTAYVAEAALRTVSRSSAGDQQVVSRSSAGDQQVVSRSSAGDQQVDIITSGDIEQKSAGDQQVVSRSSAGDQQVVSRIPPIVIDSASVLDLPKKEEIRSKKEETINNKQQIEIEEIHAIWRERFGKLKAPTIEGIAKSYKDLKKDGIVLIINWLASDHPRARLLRGETGEENRLHSATPWRPSHRTEYLSFAEEIAEAVTDPHPSLIPSSKASPKQAPTNDIAPIITKVMAIPDHLHQGYRPAVDALGPLAPELKALGGGTWGGLQERLASQYTRRATEQAIRELLERQ